MLYSPRVSLTAPFLGLAGLATTLAILYMARPWTVDTADRCALPRGIELGVMSDADRSYALRRAEACADFEHGRIGAAEYRDRVRALDDRPVVVPVAARAPVIQWASQVREVSTQYSDSSWSAERTLGPPDVYPAGGDNANAWASREADGQTEFIELGYDEPHRVNAVDIYETYNPGAVSNVEVITADGKRRSVYQGSPRAANRPSQKRHIDFACTAEPIVAVRVTLDSKAVPGWNEIDAVGISACDSQ